MNGQGEIMNTKEMLKAARKWLCRQYYTEAETSAMDGARLMFLIGKLYTGGWDQFETDTATVELASEWELSW